MPTAAFATLGCKVNQYETQRILDSFEERGFDIGRLDQPADVIVLNSCSVTQTAERKSKQMIRRFRSLNPNALVVMTGCAGEMMRIRGETLPEASLIVPNADKLRTIDRLLEAHPNLAGTIHGRSTRIPSPSSTSRRTRATIKVQDGCNVFCSFCSIPFTRSRLASRSVAEILDEVAALADRGFREFVITGVLVGWYGTDLGEGDLAYLLEAIARVSGVERVRLSSIEPTQVTPSLLLAFATNPKLCPHLHIPLQSGDNGVLESMNRPYNRDDYLQLANEVKTRVPNVAITTDIMAGFPGEDESAHQQTLDVVNQVGFARAHIFRYSPRPGTPAADMQDQVQEGVRDRRARELADACKSTQQAFIQKYLGRSLPVLVEGKEHSGGLLAGYTGNYIRVQFAGGSHLVGSVLDVRLTEVSGDHAIAEVAQSWQPEADYIPVHVAQGVLS